MHELLDQGHSLWFFFAIRDILDVHIDYIFSVLKVKRSTTAPISHPSRCDVISLINLLDSNFQMPGLILRVQVHERIFIFDSIKSPVSAHIAKHAQIPEGHPFAARHTDSKEAIKVYLLHQLEQNVRTKICVTKKRHPYAQVFYEHFHKRF